MFADPYILNVIYIYEMYAISFSVMIGYGKVVTSVVDGREAR
jgi:hypothetical protein